jgi:hypothetical protein
MPCSAVIRLSRSMTGSGVTIVVCRIYIIMLLRTISRETFYEVDGYAVC